MAEHMVCNHGVRGSTPLTSIRGHRDFRSLRDRWSDNPLPVDKPALSAIISVSSLLTTGDNQVCVLT